MTINTVRFEMHRIVWIWHYGAIPEGRLVDHINGDPSDNRIENLRLATVSENNSNRRRKAASATSRFFGVSYNTARKKWAAQGKKNGEISFLGQFDSEEEAARARDAWTAENHGAFAVLNFPPC